MRLSDYLKVILTSIALISGANHTWAAQKSAQPSKTAANEKSTAASVATDSLALYPEVLGAKAFLESLLAKRYSQELATLLNHDNFSLGASLALVDSPAVVAEREKQENREFLGEDPINDEGMPLDLTVGTLSAEEIIQKYADSEARARLHDFFADYRIKSVTVSVGLKGNLPPETKANVENWLTARLKSEFGESGKGNVAIINGPLVETKTWLDQLHQFQGLAGQVLIAVAILFGVLLWGMLWGRKSPEADNSESRAPTATTTVMAANPNPSADEDKERLRAKSEADEDIGVAQEIRQYNDRLTALAPNLATSCGPVIRSWCLSGEEGYIKLACLAEAVGQEAGRLPIPVDALQEVSKIFSQMHEYPAEKKLDTLKKAYWDLLSAINLGTESFERPFGYLGSLSVGMVNQVLIEQNPKMKTLVSLYMPPKLRESYVSSLASDTKLAVLQEASNLHDIPAEELKSFDGGFRKMLRPQDRKDVIVIESALKRLVATLTPLEEISLLPRLSGKGIDQFRQSTSSIAFLEAWPESSLRLLLERCPPDEVLAYLRVRNESADRFLSLCPPLTAEVLSDEMSRPDTSKETERNALLKSLAARMTEMVENREVDLMTVFGQAENISSIHSGDEDSEDEQKLAA